MTNHDLENWDTAAENWHQEIAQPETYRTHLITEALNKALPSVERLNILDAGCGNGFFCNWLKDKGASVNGVDGSKEMISLAKQTYPTIQFTVHDLFQPLPDNDQSYDVILANMLLMHMSNVNIFLSEASRLLKPKGTFVFSVLHPCFNIPTTRLYKSILDKILQNLPSGLSFDYYTSKTGRFEAHFQTQLSHYHRTLEEYSTHLKTAGFGIQQLIEPHNLSSDFLKKHPKLEYANRLPRFLFFICKKS